MLIIHKDGVEEATLPQIPRLQSYVAAASIVRKWVGPQDFADAVVVDRHSGRAPAA